MINLLACKRSYKLDMEPFSERLLVCFFKSRPRPGHFGLVASLTVARVCSFGCSIKYLLLMQYNGKAFTFQSARETKQESRLRFYLVKSLTSLKHSVIKIGQSQSYSWKVKELVYAVICTLISILLMIKPLWY